METQETATLVVEKETEGLKMPADDLGEPESRESSTPVQMNEAEIKASELGWKPRSEFKGDPMSYVEAEEYLKRAPLYQEQGKLKKRNRELIKLMEGQSEFAKKQFETGYRKAMSELQAQKREQIELGNVQKVEEIDKQIDQLKEDAKDVPPVVSAASAAAIDWAQANPGMAEYIAEDKDRKQFALALYDEYGGDKNPDTEKLLDYIAYSVEKKFGPRPGSPPSVPPKPNGNAARMKPAAVEGGGLPTGGGHKFGYQDLTPMEKKVCDQFVKRGDMTREEYVKAIDEQRKAGV